MAIATLGRKDPLLGPFMAGSPMDGYGEEVVTQFEYTPVERQEQPTIPDMGLNPRVLQDVYSKMPFAEAERAVSAAIQFQGLRGYQQALKEGVSANDALARYAPMMFYKKPTAAVSAMRAAQPPTMTPYQQEMISLAKKRLEQGGPKPETRSVAGGGLVQVNPDGTVKELYAPRPATTEYETITETIPEVTEEKARPASPEIPAEKRSLFGYDWLWPDRKYRPAQPAVVPHGEQRVTRRVPVNRGPAPLSQSVAPAPAPASTNAPVLSGKRVRVKAPDGRVGTISESSLEEAIKEGYTQL